MVVCEVCGEEFEYLPPHLKIHNLDMESYSEKFPNADMGLNPAKRLEVGEKISKALTGHGFTKETLKKMSEAKRDYEPWNKGLTAEEDARVKRNTKKCHETRKRRGVSFEGPNNPMYGRNHTEKSKKVMSEKRSGKCTGKDNPSFGIPRYPKMYSVSGLSHKVRSTWEEEIGKMLVSLNIDYKYEKTFPIQFLGKDKTLNPDFTFENIVIEPHVFKSMSVPLKFKEFHKQYPEYYFIILGNKKFENPNFCDKYILWDEREKLPQIIEELRSE